MAIPMKTKLAAIEREITMRKRVYPRLIAEGRITDGFAKVQMQILTEIADDYRNLVADEDLFPPEQKS